MDLHTFKKTQKGFRFMVVPPALARMSLYDMNDMMCDVMKFQPKFCYGIEKRIFFSFPPISQNTSSGTRKK